MRAIAGLFFTLLFVGVLLAIGGGIYEAGVAQGIIEAGRVPAGAAVGYAHGWGLGFHPFGFFGLLFTLLFLFFLFGLIRAALGFGRGRGWSHRHGVADGPGDGWRGGWGGKGGPEGWREERERRMAELHRRLHEEEAGSGGSSTGAPGAGAG